MVTEPTGFLPPEGARHPGTPGDDPAAALEPASWGSRAGALLVDYALIPFVLATIAAIITYAFVGDEPAYIDYFREDGQWQEEDYEWWLFAGFGAAGAWYFVGAWVVLGLWKGRSVGRRLTGNRVVRQDGGPIGLGMAFVREAIVKSLLAFMWLPLLLSYLWPLWDPRRRALHDIICSTRVVRDDGTDAVPATTERSALGTVSEPTSSLPAPPRGPLWAPPHPDMPESTAPREAADDRPRDDDDQLAKRIGLDG